MDQLLWSLGATHVTRKADYTHSVSSYVVRAFWNGRRTVAVSGDRPAEEQIKSLLDLLDLHLVGADAGARVEDSAVNVVIEEGPHFGEVRDALATLILSLRGGPEISVFVRNAGTLEPVQLTAPGYATSDTYASWPGLLKRSRAGGAPDLIDDLWEDVDHEALRLYPMLSGYPDWSLRFEGLEIGRVRNGRGWLDVGSPSQKGPDSEPRQLWVNSTGLAERFHFGPGTIKEASWAIQNFAQAWLPKLTPGTHVDPKQNEHALESRILRGACPISTSGGLPLQLVEEHFVISWGSQFPTRWGDVQRRTARYLDGLLRSGSTPWALEMKVQTGAGAGRYYRHAVGQAVLYREFIRRATPLHFWFASFGLDATACEAAVVVPEMTTHPQWRARLQAMCHLFGVDLIEVPAKYAGMSRLDV